MVENFVGTWKFVTQSDTIEETLKAQGKRISQYKYIEYNFHLLFD